jgi:hypothetical protein
MRRGRSFLSAHAGPLAVTLAFLTLGLLNLFLVPPFVARDEASHVAYALAITDGRLPRVDDINPAGALPGLQGRETWTANHPPLYYVLAAAPIEAGLRSGHPVAGLRGARAINLAFTAVAVFLAGSVGALLLPAWREAPVLGSAALGLAGSVSNNAGLAYNDGVGLAASVALLVIGLTILRRGPSRRLLALLAAIAAAGALARFTVFLAIGFSGLAAAAGVLVHQGRRRLAAAAGVLVLPFVAAGLSSGWWYLRNRELYGTLTGTDFIVAMQNRGDHGGLVDLAGTGWFWRRLYDDVWAGFERQGSLAPWPREIVEVAGALALVLLAVAAVRWWRGGRPLPDRVTGVAWGLMTLFALAAVLQIAYFYTTCGNPHARYLAAALPVAGAVGAIALRQLPDRRRPVITVALLGATMVLDLYLVHRFCVRFAPGEDRYPIAAAVIVLAGCLAVAGRAILAPCPAAPSSASTPSTP